MEFACASPTGPTCLQHSLRSFEGRGTDLPRIPPQLKESGAREGSLGAASHWRVPPPSQSAPLAGLAPPHMCASGARCVWWGGLGGRSRGQWEAHDTLAL